MYCIVLLLINYKKKLSYLPIKTGPGSFGSQTSAAFTKTPEGSVMSSPDFNFPNNGPGGTPYSTHFSNSKAPGLGCSLHT